MLQTIIGGTAAACALTYAHIVGVTDSTRIRYIAGTPTYQTDSGRDKKLVAAIRRLSGRVVSVYTVFLNAPQCKNILDLGMAVNSVIYCRLGVYAGYDPPVPSLPANNSCRGLEWMLSIGYRVPADTAWEIIKGSADWSRGGGRIIRHILDTRECNVHDVILYLANQNRLEALEVIHDRPKPEYFDYPMLEEAAAGSCDKWTTDALLGFG